jgi:hypothetical protein
LESNSERLCVVFRVFASPDSTVFAGDDQKNPRGIAVSMNRDVRAEMATLAGRFTPATITNTRHLTPDT